MELSDHLKNQYHVILLTEIYPKYKISRKFVIDQLKIPGYNLIYNCDVDYSKRGVAILIKDNIGFEYEDDQVPIEALKIFIPFLNTQIGVCYRSPSDQNNKPKIIDYVKNFFSKKACRSILIGDFNFPSIEWEKNMSSNKWENKFCKFLIQNSISQSVRTNTRIDINGCSSLLDLVLSRGIGKIDITMEDRLLGSDHLILDIKTDLDVIQGRRFFRNWAKADWVRMNKELNKINWENEFFDKNCDDCLELFMKIYDNLIRNYVPLDVSRQNTKKSTWFDKDCNLLKRKKKKYLRDFLRNKDENTRQKYHKTRNEYTKLLRNKRGKFDNNIANQINFLPKKFWNYINRFRYGKEKITSIYNGDTVIYDDQLIAECMSTNLFEQSNEGTENVAVLADFQEAQLTSIPYLNKDKIKMYIGDIKNGKSPGYDGIPSEFLKMTCENIIKPLELIFNLSICECKFPRCWKKAVVIPIFKKGNKLYPKNYRPISLLSSLSKLLERHIYECIFDHLINNDLLSADQFGFRPKRSVVDQLLQVTGYLADNVNKNCCVDIVYFDFSKAFDKVSHRKLLEKFRNLNIGGEILKWTNDYLSERSYTIKINDVYSSERPLTLGVPQGSILGPLLFLIYANDLPNSVEHSEIKMFADDTKLYRKIGCEEDRLLLQKDVMAVYRWSQAWELPLNVQKTEWMRIGRSLVEGSYFLGHCLITKNDCHKDLGIIFDSKLNFKNHIKARIGKAKSELNIIMSIFKYLKLKTFTCIFQSLVRSGLHYGSPIWNGTSKNQIC